MLAVPWALKAVWAPIIDSYRSERWGYRAWILAAQFCMGLALVPLAIVGPSSVLWLTFTCLLLHAFFAATQDVSIDALCISLIPTEERGRANGWMQAGMLFGRALFGGGTLVLLSFLGARGGVLLLIAVIWGVAAVVSRSTILSKEPALQLGKKEGVRVVVSAYRSLLRSKIVWYALGFGLFAGSVFEGLGSVAGPFLIDNGFSPETTGYFFSIPAIVAMTAGALAGGNVSDRIGSGRAALWSFLLLFVFVCALSVGLLAGVPGTDMLVGSLTLIYLGIGLFTASSYAFFMDLSVPAYRATSFSAYMGATNLCESWSAFAVGRIAASGGYGMAFGILALLSLGSLFFLRHLRRMLPSRT